MRPWKSRSKDLLSELRPARHHVLYLYLVPPLSANGSTHLTQRSPLCHHVLMGTTLSIAALQKNCSPLQHLGSIELGNYITLITSVIGICYSLIRGGTEGVGHAGP